MPSPHDRNHQPTRPPRALLPALLVTLALPALAQTQADLWPEDRSFLERLALAKARADLLNQVCRLTINEDLTVGTWAARSLDRDRTLRTWIRTQPRHRSARFFSDSTCDADVRLDPRTLHEQLERLRTDYPPPAQHQPLSARDLNRAAARWPCLWGSGTAALTERSRSRKPEGWDDVTFDGIEAARRAAESDARHALLEAAGHLQVTNARRLREFLDSSPAVRAAVLHAIERQATVKVSFALDQVAVAEARLNLVDLIRILADAHRQHYDGQLFHAADFRGIALLTQATELSATGLAVPPSTMILRARYQPLELDAPPWAAATLTATGRYEPHDDDHPTQTTRIEAARLDSIDHLRQQVEALVIQNDVTVAAFLGQHDELKDDVVIFLSGARLASAPDSPPDEAVEVTVELPLQRLWWIVRRGMQRVEVDPPESLTTQPTDQSTP